MFREAILAFLGVKQDTGVSEKISANKGNQNIGEYCKSKHIKECEKYFGNMLERVCATCPQ